MPVFCPGIGSALLLDRCRMRMYRSLCMSCPRTVAPIYLVHLDQSTAQNIYFSFNQLSMKQCHICLFRVVCQTYMYGPGRPFNAVNSRAVSSVKAGPLI